MSAFVHLSLHSEFSVNDGLMKVEEIARHAREKNFPAVALTDRSNLFGIVKFYTACRSVGVKPILGVDFEIKEESFSYRLVVLATSNSGYKNLLSLVSRSYTGDGEYGSLRKEWLVGLNEGLIVLSGGIGGDVGIQILNQDYTSAASRVRWWKEILGNRYYLEISRTGREDDIYLEQVVRLSSEIGVPLVATNDVRFFRKEDFEAHETRVCIQQGRTLNDPRRGREYTEQQYLRSHSEMLDLFSDLPEAIENAHQIAVRSNVTVELGKYYLPTYPVPDETTLEDYLIHLCETALNEFLEKKRINGEPLTDQEYRKRLQYELEVINQMGFAGYFLIVMEFVKWAKINNIPVGPGRGSGAGSLVSFCLSITDLDPIKYDLLFERLLNPERVSMPDLDIDFCMERRDEVIRHVADLYGTDAVSQIVTFGTMAAKAVVRDVARVQGKPYGLADRLSKMIPFEVGMTLEKAVAEEPELREFISSHDEVAEIMDMAFQLEGCVRNVGRHAGGVVIAPSALEEFVPLYTESKGSGAISQYDKGDVELAGLVKFDFLGLKTLTIIDWSVNAINSERLKGGEEPIDPRSLPLDDSKTYELLRSAETTAIFQLESEGMKDLIRRLLPDNINDIVALVALFRPGPLQSGAVDEYIDRKHGKVPVNYAHPSLETVLEKTYGVMLYQEDVMQVSQVLAGFSLGQADLLRKAMGKKIPEEMAKLRDSFLEGTRLNEVKDLTSNQIFDAMEKFAGYAFNRAHSAAYAMITFQTAWLKTHYPAEFMAAVLTADMQNIDKVVNLVDETLRMGIRLLTPDIRTSDYRFKAQGGEIVYGLGAVRGVGEGPVEAICEEREHSPFIDIHDFCRRLGPKKVGKRVLEALVRSGAMDSLVQGTSDLNAVRSQLLGDLDQAIQGAEQSARNQTMGITDMFDGVNETHFASENIIRELSKKERLEGEKETLGLYLTGHPIEEYADEIGGICRKRIAQLKPGRGKQVVAGLIVSSRTRRSRNGGGMAFVVLDDRSGRIEASIFGDVYESYRSKLTKDSIVFVEGEVQSSEYNQILKLRAERVFDILEARHRYFAVVEIALEDDDFRDDVPSRLKQRLTPHISNGCVVSIRYRSPEAAGRITLSDEWRVSPTDELLLSLRQEFGAQAVSMKYDLPRKFA